MEPGILIIGGLAASAISGFEIIRSSKRKSEVEERKKELERDDRNRQNQQQQERDDRNRQFEIEKLNRQERLENKKLIVSGIGILVGLVPSVVTFVKPPPVPPTLVQESQLETAIQYANDAEALSTSSLDQSHLYSVYTGNMLRKKIAKIEHLRSNGLYEASSWENQQFDVIKVSKDGLSAEVKVVEKWESTVYRIADRQCINNRYSILPQTVYLQYVENRWKINSVVFDSSTKEERPCHLIPI